MVEAGVNKLDFSSRQALDEALAHTVAGILRGAIARWGEASLVVSGGSTPVNFFRVLSAASLDWSRVTILLADERWVPPEHQDSNERLVRENLLVGAAANAHFVPLKTPHVSASEAELEVAATLAGIGRFDLVMLGMGSDGHTASLFPGKDNLAEGLDLNSTKPCLAVEPSTAPYQRMTLTLARLLDSERIFVHITGREKQYVLDQARKAVDPFQLPIAAILCQQKTPVTVFFAE